MTCTNNTKQQEKQKDLKWWQLSLIGVGCTIGTGFFLGSSVGIKIGGPAIIIAFVLNYFYCRFYWHCSYSRSWGLSWRQL